MSGAVNAAAMGRTFAESLMTSTCRVHRRGEPVMDPETGIVTAVDGDLVYDGACRVKPGGTGATGTDVGGVEFVRFDYIVSVPFSATGITKGDRLRITSSPDASLVGIELEVQKPAAGDVITARRLPCTEVI